MQFIYLQKCHPKQKMWTENIRGCSQKQYSKSWDQFILITGTKQRDMAWNPSIPFFFFFGWKLENVLKKVYQIGSELLKCQQKELKQKPAMADGLTVVGWCAMMEFLLSPFILYFFFLLLKVDLLLTPPHTTPSYKY